MMGVKPIQRSITDQVLDNTLMLDGSRGLVAVFGKSEAWSWGREGGWWEMEDSVRSREFGDCGGLDDWR